MDDAFGKCQSGIGSCAPPEVSRLSARRSSSRVIGTGCSGNSMSNVRGSSVTFVSTSESRSVMSEVARPPASARMATTAGRPLVEIRVAHGQRPPRRRREPPPLRPTQEYAVLSGSVSFEPVVGGRVNGRARRRHTVGKAAAGNQRPERVGPERDAGDAPRRSARASASASTRSSRVSTSVARGPSATSRNTGLPNGGMPSSRMRPGASKPASIRPRSFVEPLLPESAHRHGDRPDAAAVRRRLICTRPANPGNGVPAPVGRIGACAARSPPPDDDQPHERRTRSTVPAAEPPNARRPGDSSDRRLSSSSQCRSSSAPSRARSPSPSPASARCHAAIASARTVLLLAEIAEMLLDHRIGRQLPGRRAERRICEIEPALLQVGPAETVEKRGIAGIDRQRALDQADGLVEVTVRARRACSPGN